MLYSLGVRYALHAWERDADNNITAIGSGLSVVVVVTLAGYVSLLISEHTHTYTPLHIFKYMLHTKKRYKSHKNNANNLRMH